MRHNIQVWLLRLRRLDWIALSAVLLVSSMLIVLSIMRYTGYNAGMLDIGDMAQAIWNGTQGRPLEYTEPLQDAFGVFNVSRLAMHVELIYFLLLPLYALLPDPRTLLVFQAVLFAAGAWPVYRLAMRHLKNRNLARALVLCYLFFPVAQTAVLFDFHGDTLAMPLLLFALEALDRRAWRNYAVWIVLALACKFYVAVAVAVLGGVLWLQGQRRAGIWTFLAATAWLGVVLLIIRPWFAPPNASEAHTTFFSYLQFYFGGFGVALTATALQRVLTLVVIFLPGLWLGRYAWRWALPALAIAGPALISLGDHASYDFRFHHYAVAVPFLIIATLYGTVELRRRQMGEAGETRRRGRPWRGELYLTVVITIIFAVGLVDTPLNPKFWSSDPASGMGQWRYGRIPRDTFKDRWLGQYVPPRAPLAANESLAPHLANRQTLAMIGHSDERKRLSILDDVQYVVADALADFAFPLSDDEFIGGILQDAPGIQTVMEHPEFALLVAQDGLLLFGRNPDSRDGLVQTLTLREWDGQESEPQFYFQERIGLLSAQTEPVGGLRFRLRFEWVPLQSLDERPPMVAVSRLEGVDLSRIVHLPTLALHPTSSWKMGQVIEEEFEIVLPPELPAGSYRLLTGWYEGASLYAASTDPRSRIGDEFNVGTIELE